MNPDQQNLLLLQLEKGLTTKQRKEIYKKLRSLPPQQGSQELLRLFRYLPSQTT